VRYWTLEEATAALPEVATQVTRLRELIQTARTNTSSNGAKASGNGHGPATSGSTEAQKILTALTDQGTIVRDPERGLIDFPAQAPSGRTYLLCWLEGEDAITWWHWEEDGFAGRTPLTEPPD